MEWLGLLGSQAVNRWAGGRAKASVQGGSQKQSFFGCRPPLTSPSPPLWSCLWEFSGFPWGRQGGRGGVGHNGRFQNTQILCSFQLVWVTRQGWWCVTKCKFQPQYWSIMGGGGPGGKWPRRYQAEDGDISSEKRRMGRTDGKIGEYFLRG